MANTWNISDIDQYHPLSIMTQNEIDTLFPETRFLNDFKMFFSNLSNIFLLTIAHIYNQQGCKMLFSNQKQNCC